jgi:hypothetical protein
MRLIVQGIYVVMFDNQPCWGFNTRDEAEDYIAGCAEYRCGMMAFNLSKHLLDRMDQHQEDDLVMPMEDAIEIAEDIVMMTDADIDAFVESLEDEE